MINFAACVSFDLPAPGLAFLETTQTNHECPEVAHPYVSLLNPDSDRYSFFRTLLFIEDSELDFR